MENNEEENKNFLVFVILEIKRDQDEIGIKVYVKVLEIFTTEEMLIDLLLDVIPIEFTCEVYEIDYEKFTNVLREDLKIENFRNK